MSRKANADKQGKLVVHRLRKRLVRGRLRAYVVDRLGEQQRYDG